MKILLMIGTGSFLGGIGRYLLSRFILNNFPSSFPFGTLCVNIIGCLLIGVVCGIDMRASISTEWRSFLSTGLLGGFTTFSAFSNESVTLLREGQFGYAISYIIASILFGLLATCLGYFLIKIIA